jgi:hypothetical protein
MGRAIPSFREASAKEKKNGNNFVIILMSF